MAMTLAGIPLTLLDKEDEIESFILKYINPESYRPWLRRSFPGWGYMPISQPTGMTTDYPFKLNKLYWPVWGACRWAYGHFLADAERLEYIRAEAFGTDGNSQSKIEFIMSSPGASSEESLFCDMYLLPPTPLSSVPVDNENHTVNNLFLLTIVDPRYYWWYKATPEVNFTDSSSWTSAFSIARTALGLNETTFSVDSISSAFLNASPQLNYSYDVLPPWIDALCFNVGHRLAANFDGTYETQRYLTAVRQRNLDIRDHPKRQITAGGLRFQDKII